MVFIAVAQGEYNQAHDYFQKFVDIQKEIGNPDEQTAEVGAMGGVYLQLGNPQLARQNLYEAMQLIVDFKGIWGASWTLPWVALYLAKRGDIERAVEVYAMASKLPMVANSKWFPEVVEKEIVASCVNLSPEAIAAAKDRGKKADIFATVADLLEELKE